MQSGFTVYAIGKPDVKKLPKVEFDIFIKELLNLIIKDKQETIEKKSA